MPIVGAYLRPLTRSRATSPEDDEAILNSNFAQMASIAIENTLYAEERESNRLKDEFSSRGRSRHELRTPAECDSRLDADCFAPGPARRGGRLARS